MQSVYRDYKELSLLRAGLKRIYILTLTLTLLLALTTVTGTTTFVQISVPFPDDASLVGQTFYSQYMFFDPTANPLGILMTNGRINRNIPAPVGITRIYASGNPAATAGTLGLQFAVPVGLN